MKNNQYQVAIIGAGPAGSSCAIQLLRNGVKKVVLINAGNFEKFKIGESIPPIANRLFHELGIYHAFVKEGHEPCHGSRSFWGGDKVGYNDFLLDANGHGWHLNRTKFDFFLAKHAEKMGAKLLTNTSFRNSRNLKEDGFELELKNPKNNIEIIQAKIVVDASGSRGVFASAQGAKKISDKALVCLGRRYQLSDLSSTISKLTFIEAAENGWWYAARLPGEQLLVTLYSDMETIKNNKLNQLDEWERQLALSPNLSELITGLIPTDGKLVGAPAPSFILDKVTGDNWLAVGDAASAYDPITSQGIIKAITNGANASMHISEKFNGRISDFNEYGNYIKSNFEKYKTMRSYFYGEEKRWIHSAFWQQMQNLDGVMV